MRLSAPLVALLLGPLVASRGAAHPYAALRPMDNVLSGPTDGGLSALHYNPAALRLSRGLHLEAQVGLAGYLGSYEREAPLPAGFAPGSAAGDAQRTLIRWPVPGYFIGGSWDLGTESVSIGVALYTPYADGTGYAPDDDEGQLAGLATRYHAVSARTYNLWGSVAAGLRITPWLYLGGGFNFAWTRERRHLYRDPAPARDGLVCGDAARCETWDQRQDLRLDVGGFGFGFAAGLVIVPIEERLWIGASYTSPLFTSGGAQVSLSGQPKEGAACPADQQADFAGAVLAGGGNRCHGGAELVTSFPHLLYLSGRVRVAPAALPRRPRHIEIASFVRLAMPARRDEELRLERGAFSTFDVPASQILPAGTATAVAVELGVRELWGRLQLGQAVQYESPRARLEAVTPARMEGHRLDGSITGRLWLHRSLALVLSAGVTFVVIPQGAGDRINPALADVCRKSGYDVLVAACREVQDGWAQPLAAGRYQLTIPHGAAGIEVTL